MTRQIKHTRVSKKGTPFKAGSRKEAPPQPDKLPLMEIKMPMTFMKIIRFVQSLINEANTVYQKHYFGLTNMDPANVAMVDLWLDASGPMIKTKQEANLGLNMVDLYKVIRDVQKGDELALFTNNTKTSVIVQYIRGGIPTRVALPVIEIEQKEQKLPDLKPTFRMDAMTWTLINAIKTSDKVAESIKFVSKPNGIVWTAEGDLSKSDGLIGGTANGEFDQKAKYSIEYLKKLLPILSLNMRTVAIEYGKDYPLMVRIDAPGMRIRFILAPRVDNDTYSTIDDLEAFKKEVQDARLGNQFWYKNTSFKVLDKRTTEKPTEVDTTDFEGKNDFGIGDRFWLGDTELEVTDKR